MHCTLDEVSALDEVQPSNSAEMGIDQRLVGTRLVPTMVSKKGSDGYDSRQYLPHTRIACLGGT